MMFVDALGSLRVGLADALVDTGNEAVLPLGLDELFPILFDYSRARQLYPNSLQ